jgi:HK97 family phage major capsid protein
MTDIIAKFEGAMNDFAELQKMMTKTKDKVDALDIEKLNNLEKSIGDAMELSQKLQAKSAADEKRISDLEKAGSLMTFGKVSDEDAISKEFAAFVRQNNDNKSTFSSKMLTKDMSINSNANGGFLVIPTFGGIIKTKVFESSPMRQLADTVSISSDKFEFIGDDDEAGAVWDGEIPAGSNEATAVVYQSQIFARNMNSNVRVTQDFLDDASVNVESWLAGKTADKFARAEATAFISGNLTTRPRGILTYANGTGRGQVQQINSGSAASIIDASGGVNGLIDTQNALKEVYQPNAKWLMKRSTYGALMKAKTGISGDNRPIFNMMYDKNNGIAMSMYGSPVLFADDMPAIAAGALSVAYGDFKKAYLIVDRVGLRVLRDPYTQQGLVKFISTRRVGGEVVTHEAIKILKISV